MSKQQKRILVVLGIVLVVVLIGVMGILDITSQLSKSRAEYRTTLNAIEAEHEKTMAAIHH